jgi:tetratricopeptide (TPR) repeat protein
MRRATLAITLLIGLNADPSTAAGGAPKKSTQQQPSPREQAIEQYNRGLKHRDKAWKQEKKAAAASKQKDRDKKLRKARKEYGKAIERQLSATTTDPRFHEAFSSLGYAYRKTGEYTLALAAYDRCLELAPDYAEAVEYRGEAFLGLDRVEEAQSAYHRLVALDRDRAAELLEAMASWVDERRTTPVAGIDPERIDPEKIDAVERWIADKQMPDPATDDSAGGGKW